MKDTKIYFAHSKLIYNTPIESVVIQKLKSAGYNVFDPNKDLSELGSITLYLKTIDTCDEVICFPYRDFIGKGVYEELKHAIKNQKFCFTFIHNSKSPHGFDLKEIMGVRIYEITDWKFKYGKLIY